LEEETRKTNELGGYFELHFEKRHANISVQKHFVP
jgi:hypothetical protein